MLDFVQQQGTLYLIGFSFVFMLIVWSLNRLQRSFPSPVNKLIVRWVRLMFIGIFIALAFKLTFFSSIPLWRLFVMGLLAWLLLDSGYLWLYILTWDRSELPLFPSVRQVEKVDWPANKRFFLIRDWIRENNYQEIGSFKFFFEDEALQQMIVYESPDAMVRLQVVIVTDVTGVILDQIVFTSDTDQGLVITDNVFMPFGGVYPENWKVKRFPAIRKIQTIAKYHQDTLSKDGEACCLRFETDALTWLIDQQNTLEKENIEAGILNMRQDREEYGKMTGEGRYRIWKELLLLSYFSISSLRRS